MHLVLPDLGLIFLDIEALATPMPAEALEWTQARRDARPEGRIHCDDCGRTYAHYNSYYQHAYYRRDGCVIGHFTAIDTVEGSP